MLLVISRNIQKVLFTWSEEISRNFKISSRKLERNFWHVFLRFLELKFSSTTNKIFWGYCPQNLIFSLFLDISQANPWQKSRLKICFEYILMADESGFAVICDHFTILNENIQILQTSAKSLLLLHFSTLLDLRSVELKWWEHSAASICRQDSHKKPETPWIKGPVLSNLVSMCNKPSLNVP